MTLYIFVIECAYKQPIIYCSQTGRHHHWFNRLHALYCILQVLRTFSFLNRGQVKSQANSYQLPTNLFREL